MALLLLGCPIRRRPESCDRKAECCSARQNLDDPNDDYDDRGEAQDPHRPDKLTPAPLTINVEVEPVAARCALVHRAFRDQLLEVALLHREARLEFDRTVGAERVLVEED